MALFSHSMASSMALFSLSLSSSATLPSNLEFSRLFLASIFLRWSSSSDLYFSASATMRSISSLDRRPLSLVMVILFFWPVLLSSAETLRMELASMSKITLIWGTPRGAGGIPESSNLPRRLLSLVRARSPSKTWIITPPAVSRPMESGVTSSRSRSCTVSLWSPPRMAACTAAPYATASSGLMLLQSSFPLKKSWRRDCTLGMRVEPPTRTTSWIWPLSILASRSTFSTGSMQERKRSMQSSSKRARDGGEEVHAFVEGVDLHRGLGRGGERALGALAGGPQAAQGALVAGVEQVLLGLALELRAEVVEEAVVEVLPAEVGVAGGGLDLEDALLDGQQGDVEGPAPEVEDDDVALARHVGLLVEAVRDGRRRGLVDDPHHVQPGDGAGVLGGLALRVVEVRGHGDHGVLDGLAQVGLGDLLHLHKDHR